MADLFETKHPGVWRPGTRAAWRKVIEAIEPKLSTLDVDEFTIALRRAVALLHDGHSSVVGLPDSPLLTQRFPVRFEAFSDGFFVVAADRSLREFLGGQLVAVEGRSIDEIVASLMDTVSADNTYAARDAVALGPLLRPALLHHLKLAAAPDCASFEFRLSDGNRRTVKLVGAEYSWFPYAPPPPEWVWWIDTDVETAPLWLRHSENRVYWMTSLDDGKTLYAQVNFILDAAAAKNHSSKMDAERGLETFLEFTTSLLKSVDERRPERLVIDLRHNRGGDNTLIQPLIHGLIARPSINQPGRLYIITSPKTFSAAMNLAAEIEQNTRALFVGEPTGAGPNHFGDAEVLTLPRTGILVSVSTLHWAGSSPLDQRSAIYPDLLAPLSARDYAEGRDPALAAIAAFDVSLAESMLPKQPQFNWQRQSQMEKK